MINYKEKALGVFTYVQKHITIILLILILAMGSFYLIKDAVTKVKEREIVSSRDTVISVTHTLQPIVKEKEYVPIYSKDTVFIKEVTVPTEYIPSTDIKGLQAQVEELGQKLFKLRQYKDSVILRDTSGIYVGKVDINDDISENTIKGRKIDYTLSIPQRTLTITKTIEEPKRTKVYAGLEGEYVAPFSPEGGIGFLIKSKNDNILRVSAGGQLSGAVIRPYFSLGYYPLISFRSKK